MTVNLCWRFDCFAFPFGVEVGGDFVFRSSPRVPSSEVDVSVYIPFFYFYIFYIQQPPFIPNHDGRLKWSAGTRFHPFLSSLNRVDRMKPNCGLLRFAGEVRLRAPATYWVWLSHLNVPAVLLTQSGDSFTHHSCFCFTTVESSEQHFQLCLCF